MDQLFGSLKSFFKRPSVKIDNHAFRLHYRASVIILIAFSLMVTSEFVERACPITDSNLEILSITGKQYFGDPIDCISKDDLGKGQILGMFAFFHPPTHIGGIFCEWSARPSPFGLSACAHLSHRASIMIAISH